MGLWGVECALAVIGTGGPVKRRARGDAKGVWDPSRSVEHLDAPHVHAVGEALVGARVAEVGRGGALGDGAAVGSADREAAAPRHLAPAPAPLLLHLLLQHVARQPQPLSHVARTHARKPAPAPTRIVSSARIVPLTISSTSFRGRSVCQRQHGRTQTIHNEIVSRSTPWKTSRTPVKARGVRALEG
eukprot:1178943-Prorocentrum_minimum.AAC.2